MSTLTFPYPAVAGTKIKSAEYNANNAAISTLLNTTKLNDDNIQEAGISGTKLKANVVDDSTLQLSAGVLSAKDEGITLAKLAAAVAASLVPAGTLLEYAGSSAPTGYLMAYGQAVSRTTYADLFSAIGTTYGAGDGSTTFNVIDKRGRVGVGKDDMGGSAAGRTNVTTNGTTTNGSAVITAIASTAGLSVGMSCIGTGVPASTTVLSIDSATQVTLSANATASATVSLRFGVIDGATLGAVGGAHVHALVEGQGPSHKHHMYFGNGVGGAQQVVYASSVSMGANDGLSLQTTAIDGFNAMTTSGSGHSHPNLQPSIVVNYIIKT